MPEIPADAKKPQDKKPKTVEVDVHTVTVNDQEWTVEAAALDDFELLDELRELEAEENGTVLPSILKRLLGKEQYRRAMQAARDPESGRVTVEAGANFVQEIMGALNPNS